MAAGFHPGDLVDVKGHGRATVLKPVVADAAHPMHGRVLVRYHEDGTTFHCNPRKLRQLQRSASRVLVCFRTEHYRAAAVHNVERKDVCLEVGCHSGTTTRILFNRCTQVVGVDNVPSQVEISRQKSPHVRFELADGFDVQALRALSPTGAFDKIFVDISGKAPLPLIARLLCLYLGAFPQSSIVVKNEALYTHLEQREAQQAQRGPQQAQQPRGAQQAEQAQQQGAQQAEQQGAQQAGEQQAGGGACAAQGGCCGSGAADPAADSLAAAAAVAAATVGLAGAEAAAAAGVESAGGAAVAGAAGGAGADDDLVAQLLPHCDLFRNDGYISHHLTHVKKGRPKWGGRGPAETQRAEGQRPAGV